MHKLFTPELKLVLKHYKLIENARRRGYSAKAIAKLVKSVEESER